MIMSTSSKSTTKVQEAIAPLLVAVLRRDTIPVLTMTDPWGSLVASGAKRIETRSWSTTYRGPLAIHVAKTLPPGAEALCYEDPFCQALEAAGYTWTYGALRNAWNLPLGCVVAIVRLEKVECISPDFVVEEPERIYGNYALGRFAWRFSQVYRLQRPLPARGALGIWQWTPP